MNPDLHSLAAGLGLVMYLLAVGVLWQRPLQPLLPRLLALAGIALHACILHNDMLRDGALYFAIGPATSLFAWQCALLVWLFALVRPLQHLTLAVYPLAGLALASTWLPGAEAANSFTGGWPLGLHVLLSLLAYGVLSIAVLQALALLLQDRGLRRHHIPGWLQRLPALESMELLLFQLMGLGLFLLSLSLLSGLLFVQDLFAQHLVHKTVLSIIAWLVFAVLLWGRWRFGWRGRKAINWTLGGYASLLLAYFGSKWVLEVLLGQSWN